MSELMTHRIFFDSDEVPTPFLVEQVNPRKLSREQLILYGTAIRNITENSWRKKLVPGLATETDIKRTVPSAEDQAIRIARPFRYARYWVARAAATTEDELSEASEVQGFLRVETYKPLSPFTRQPPFIRRRLPYPNITDLEMRSGSVTGAHANQAAALLYFSLGEFTPDSKCAAYELGAGDGVEFYGDVGLQRTGKTPTMPVGSKHIETIHLEVPSIAGVRTNLASRYPWLTSGTGA